ncbi:MAG: hypothetical protein GYA51_19045, partial [Candidatus Methanofastidiosa archaeon]|nr:hypothetical protein [Candidatus Methanofastidiosa archaeon]
MSEEVLRLLAEGKTYQEISDLLHISKKTIAKIKNGEAVET